MSFSAIVTADVTDESASVTGDAEVDELLSGASSLEEYRESDEEPPEVDLGDPDDGDSGCSTYPMMHRMRQPERRVQ